MTMTRKDYVAVAKALHDLLETEERGVQRGVIVEVAGQLASAFLADNPRFSPSRFMSAVVGRPYGGMAQAKREARMGGRRQQAAS